MKTLNLLMHCGAQVVDFATVQANPTPRPTSSHVPIPHADMFDLVSGALSSQGLHIKQSVHAMTSGSLDPKGYKGRSRYFAMCEVSAGEKHDPAYERKRESAQMLANRATTNGERAAALSAVERINTRLSNGSDWSTVIGIRNSHDKTMSAGLVCGSGVLVCDNLCFSGEVKIARKHTVNVMRDLPQMVVDAVGKVAPMQAVQASRIEAYKSVEIDEHGIYPLLIEAYDNKVINAAKIAQVLEEWRAPTFGAFADDNTVWGLWNAFTEVLKPRQAGHDLWTMPGKTIALHGILDTACGLN